MLFIAHHGLSTSIDRGLYWDTAIRLRVDLQHTRCTNYNILGKRWYCRRHRCFLRYVYPDNWLGSCNLTRNNEEFISGSVRRQFYVSSSNESGSGKSVTRLVYQAYSKIAIKTLSSIATNAIVATGIIRCAIYHRLGEVPVGETSIGSHSQQHSNLADHSAVIAVSAPHRKEAFLACEEILEEVKKKAQIWKKEYYEGENEAEWKTNT